MKKVHGVKPDSPSKIWKSIFYFAKMCIFPKLEMICYFGKRVINEKFTRKNGGRFAVVEVVKLRG